MRVMTWRALSAVPTAVWNPHSLDQPEAPSAFTARSFKRYLTLGPGVTVSHIIGCHLLLKRGLETT
jgi:hypothetical protein